MTTEDLKKLSLQELIIWLRNNHDGISKDSWSDEIFPILFDKVGVNDKS